MEQALILTYFKICTESLFIWPFGASHTESWLNLTGDVFVKGAKKELSLLKLSCFYKQSLGD